MEGLIDFKYIMKSVINLVKTSQGYSLLQGDIEVNKSATKPAKEKAFSLPKKFAQQNFTIYPYIYAKESDHQKYMLLPARAQWFNLNSVHQIQKKALPEWFKIKKGILATMNNIKFEKHQELYKKYRNYIIQLAGQQYLSPLRARKGLAGDVCAIIRIHNFLQKWGLINYIHKKKQSPSTAPTRPPLQHQQVSKIQPSKRKDCFDRDKLIVSRSYGKDDLELLKKITKKYRSICHYCEGITGIVWYEYIDTVYLKEFVKSQSNQCTAIVRSSEGFKYELRVCASCFHDGNIPIIFTQQDFTKRSILEQISQFAKNQQIDKKKSNQFNKIADVIQKTKFNIQKSAQILKMSVDQLYKTLMIMPIQRLQKLSRIEQQTDDEEKRNKSQDRKDDKTDINSVDPSEAAFYEKEMVDLFKEEVTYLDEEERKIYEELLQIWLLKLTTKMENLANWETSVAYKLKSMERYDKNTLAEKVRLAAQKLN